MPSKRGPAKAPRPDEISPLGIEELSLDDQIPDDACPVCLESLAKAWQGEVRLNSHACRAAAILQAAGAVQGDDLRICRRKRRGRRLT